MTWKLDILAFHRILPAEEKYFIPPMRMDKDDFYRLMKALCARYRILALMDATAAIRANRLKGRALCLTFDDGYIDNYEHAADILLTLGLPATFFVPVRQIENQESYWWDYLDNILRNFGHDFCMWAEKLGPDPLKEILVQGKESLGSDNGLITRQSVRILNSLPEKARVSFLSTVSKEFGPYQGPRLLMNKKEMKKLVDSGFELGSHTVSHVPLTDLDPQQAEKEIMESRKTLQQIFNTRISSFCYPRGAWNQELAAVVEKAGYDCAVTTAFGSNSSPHNLFALKRRNMQDFQGIRSRFPVISNLVELSGRLDFILSSRR